MLIILFAIGLFVFIVLMLFLAGRDDSVRPKTRYDSTGSFMDFDPGKDASKVGDSRYPTAGADSVMKEEFMEDLFDDRGGK